MGKASRKKQQDEQKRQFIANHGDGRSNEERANARAMLDALQKKLEDDALREDGFFFVNGKFADSRKPRLTPGMKMRDFRGHVRNITDIEIVRVPASRNQSNKEIITLFTFGLDCVTIWDFSNGKRLSSLDVSPLHARSICGAAVLSRYRDLDVSTASIIFSYATHHELVAHRFDYQSNVIAPAVAPAMAFDVASNYCTGHQQTISCMTFSHDSGLLATASLDSTCMIWEVTCTEKVCDQQTGSHLTEAASIELTLLCVLPVHDEGASCLSFTWDDNILVTCGECVVKVWEISRAFQENAQQQKETENPTPLATRLLAWKTAIPYSYSIETSMNFFSFDETMAALVSNSEWVHDRGGLTPRSLLAPAQSDDERNAIMDTKQCLQDIITHIDSNNDTEYDPRTMFVRSDPTGNRETNSTRSSIAITDDNDSNALTPAERARLKSYFRSMKDFDFETLFTPVLSLSPGQNEDCNLIPAKCVTRTSSCSDGGDRLLRTFSNITSEGIFSSHTSTITGCAVAQELDLVVTVSLDRSIRYWSLSKGHVLETVRDAHDSGITCCALTSPTTCDLSVYEMLLATGGSDNLVKVWRRNAPDRAECVCSLSGHYDTITSTVFDPTGVFLISASEDTMAITWRVRPSSPDQPEVPVVATVDRFAIGISWMEPLANGAKILYYIVRTKQMSSFADDGSDIQVVPDLEVPAKYLSKSIDRLRPGVKYTLQIAAVNQIGVSPFSFTTEPIETLAFIPSRVERPVQYTDRQATHISLSWVAPCPNGATILSYTIQCRPENKAFVPLREITIPVADLKVVNTAPAKVEINSSHRKPVKSRSSDRGDNTKTKLKPKKKGMTKAAVRAHKEGTGGAPVGESTEKVSYQSALSPEVLSYIVDDLWPGEVYQFVVAASNRCGLGEFSRVTDYVKMNCMAPDQPEKPVFVNVDKRQVEVQWKKPRCNGSEILQYTVRWHQEVEGGVGFIEQAKCLLTRSIVGTKYTLHDLDPGCPLQVWVSASNLVDNKLLTSPESLPTDRVFTLCDVPDTPEVPEILEPTAHTMLLTWVPPKRNGLQIDTYNIALYSEDTQFGVCIRQLYREFIVAPDDLKCCGTGTAVSYLVRHVRASVYYSATVSASNSLGTSNASVACVPVQTTAPIAPDTVFDAPVVSDITPTSAVIAWKLPAHDGGAALRGFHVEYSVRPTRSNYRLQEKVESGGEIFVSRGVELHATFLKPHRAYRFRVSPENRVGRASPSMWSADCTTPSLIEFTVTHYFAHRPPEEYEAARVVQRRFRTWRQAVSAQAKYNAALLEVLRHWHM